MNRELLTEADRERAERANVAEHNRRIEGAALARAKSVKVRPGAREVSRKVESPRKPNALEQLRLAKQAVRQAR